MGYNKGERRKGGSKEKKKVMKRRIRGLEERKGSRFQGNKEPGVLVQGRCKKR